MNKELEAGRAAYVAAVVHAIDELAADLEREGIDFGITVEGIEEYLEICKEYGSVDFQ